MKLFKNIISSLMLLLNIPLSMIMSAGCVWYVLPNLRTTKLGVWLLNTLTSEWILGITLASTLLYFTFLIIGKFFNKDFKAKAKNFFIHTSTWLIPLVATALAVYTFVMSDVVATERRIDLVEKICIGADFVLLFIAFIFSSKISKIVNRRLQAYETAKEMNVVGRGSIIWTNILKLFEIFFPEALVLLLVCFCLGWNASIYFIVILVSFILPTLGNIECDFNIRSEIKRHNEQANNELVEKVANKVKGE